MLPLPSSVSGGPPVITFRAPFGAPAVAAARRRSDAHAHQLEQAATDTALRANGGQRAGA